MFSHFEYFKHDKKLQLVGSLFFGAILKQENLEDPHVVKDVAAVGICHDTYVSSAAQSAQAPGLVYRLFKATFDLSISLILMPVFLVTALALLLLNPWLNPGPLFFVQVRMGKDCKPFYAYKFRSMVPADRMSRSANDPLEIDRISRFGQLIRKTRFDELPQLINVFRREMSLIGPRPDFFSHAKVFMRTIPGYRQRHAALPGISGYAQTEVGYVEGIDATYEKVRADLYYIKNHSISLDVWIFWRTIKVVFGRCGL